MQEKDLKERDCMSFEAFTKCICLDFRDMLIGVEVEIRENLKTNDVKLYGLTIVEGGNCVAPIIYLEGYYDEYLRGRELEEIEQNILDIYHKSKDSLKFDPRSFCDWNWVKERIVFKLINREMNREYLKKVPYVPYLDMAVVFHCPLESDKSGETNVPVCNNHLDIWGITKDELYAAAMANTPKLLPPAIQSMGEVMMELMGNPCDMPISDEEGALYILSNRNRRYGAGCLLYKDVLEKFSDSHQGADLYILPSSIHEVILIPVTEELNPEKLVEMIHIVNAEQLAPEEVLSDNLYQFVRKTGEVIIAGGKENE